MNLFACNKHCRSFTFLPHFRIFYHHQISWCDAGDNTRTVWRSNITKVNMFSSFMSRPLFRKTWLNFQCWLLSYILINKRNDTMVRCSKYIQCSLNNFELGAIIMTNISPDHNTFGSKTVGLIHTLVRNTIPTPMVHTITSIAKTKRKLGFITKTDVLPCVKPPTTACTSRGWSRVSMVLFKDSFYHLVVVQIHVVFCEQLTLNSDVY